MAFVYILHSLKLDKSYIGSTSVDPTIRLDMHNSGYYEISVPSVVSDKLATEAKVSFGGELVAMK